jgi:hypothetical protein
MRTNAKQRTIVQRDMVAQSSKNLFAPQTAGTAHVRAERRRLPPALACGLFAGEEDEAKESTHIWDLD